MQPVLDQQLSQSTTTSPSLLVRAERAGLFDALLVAISIAQYFLLNYLILNDSRPPVLLIGPVLLVWIVLAMGSLATRVNKPTKPGELPRGSGLHLCAWGIVFVFWALLVFNEDDDALWGFWHLTRLPDDRYAVLASFLPLIFLPVWRRLYRSIKLSLFRRRRAAGLHGAMRIPLWPVWAIAAACVYACVFKDRAIMSDGWGLVGFTRYYGDIGPDSFREPLFILLLRDGSQPLIRLGLNTAQAIGLINSIVSLLAFVMVHLQMRRWKYTRVQLAAGWILMLSCLGMTQMFLGHIELYPLLIFGMIATIYAGLGMLERDWSPAWVSLTYAITLAGHLSSVFILPAVILMFWLRAVPKGRLVGPVNWPRLIHGYAVLLGCGLLIHGPLWFGLMVNIEHPTPLGFVGTMMHSLNTGADNLTFIGSNAPTWLGQIREILSPENLLKIFQGTFYLAGGPLLACLIAVAAKVLGWKPTRCENRPDPKSAAVLWVAFLGYLAYFLAWHADWAWKEDWDLFSGIAPVALLLSIRLLMPVRGVIRVPYRLLALAGLFTIALGSLQHDYNHINATFLNQYKKMDANPVYGGHIQYYQLTHEYPRSTRFGWENGHIVITPPKKSTSGAIK